jgi:hypothetical protein
MPTVSVSRNPTVETSKGAFEAESSQAASSPLKRVLIGTSAAPAHCAPRAATIQPRPFGAQIATRSPGPTPAPIMARVEATRSSPSSP